MNTTKDTRGNELYILSPEAKNAIINYFTEHSTITELPRENFPTSYNEIPIQIPNNIIKIVKVRDNYYAFYKNDTQLSLSQHGRRRAIKVSKVNKNNKKPYQNILTKEWLSAKQMNTVLQTKTSKNSKRLQLDLQNALIIQQMKPNKRNNKT